MLIINEIKGLAQKVKPSLSKQLRKYNHFQKLSPCKITFVVKLLASLL
jgi:hypothetical protein